MSLSSDTANQVNHNPTSSPMHDHDSSQIHPAPRSVTTPRPQVSVHGVHVAAEADNLANVQRAEAIVFEEIGRLGHVFDRGDDNSMLNRWIVGTAPGTSSEFDELLWTALEWQRCSRGVFNVSTGRLRDLWERSAIEGCRPSRGELHEAALDIAEAPYRFDGHLLRQIRNCRDLDLAAIVDGFIIDRAFEAAWRLCDLNSLVVSAHGMVVHRGDVHLELTTSAANYWFGDAPAPAFVNGSLVRRQPNPERALDAHPTGNVFDPATGQRTNRKSAITVMAPNATTADAVATIVSIMTPDQGMALVDFLNAPSPTRHSVESFVGIVSGPITCWIVDVQSGAGYTGE